MFWNNKVIKFNKSLLIKLPKEILKYDYVDNNNINKNKTNYIPQEIFQF